MSSGVPFFSLQLQAQHARGSLPQVLRRRFPDPRQALGLLPGPPAVVLLRRRDRVASTSLDAGSLFPAQQIDLLEIW